MRLQSRDHQLINFIIDCPATTFTLDKMFFDSYAYAKRRLKKLADHGHIKRTRKDINDPYVYYLGYKPNQLQHLSLVSEFYCRLEKSGGKVKRFIRERALPYSIRPDGMFLYKIRGVSYLLALEVEISNNSSDKKIRKYEQLYQSNELGDFPTIVYISDKNKIESDIIPVVHIKTDFSNWEEFISRL